MSATVLYMSMSLDGFIAGPNERLDNGLGDGGQRLHEWTEERAGANGQVIDEFNGDRGGRLRSRDHEDRHAVVVVAAPAAGRLDAEPP